MQKLPAWLAITFASIWLVWAMSGEAPAEAWTSETVVRLVPMLGQRGMNQALCQDAIERRQRLLTAYKNDPLVVSMTTLSSLTLDRWKESTLDASKEYLRPVFSQMATMTRDVERHCGQ